MPSLLTKLATVAVALTTCASAENASDAMSDLPSIQFVGKAPKFKVFPTGAKEKGGTWILLEFGKIQEMTADGKPVQAHSINSLAAEKVAFVESNETMQGVDVKVVTMSLNLPFDITDCKGPTPPGDVKTGGIVTIKTAIFFKDVELPYGNYTVPIQKGNIKFDIESTHWPFCSKDNSLAIHMAVKMPSEDTGAKEKKPRAMADRPKPPKKDMDAMTKEERREAKRPKSKKFTADAGGAGVEMDLPEVVLLDNQPKDAVVEMVDMGGKTSIKLTFPYFNQSLIYDPAVGFDSTEQTDNKVNGSVHSSVWGSLLVFVSTLLARSTQ